MSHSPAYTERLLEAYKGLVEVSALINSITDPAALLTAILDVARRVMGAEAASLFLVRPNGDLILTHATPSTAVSLDSQPPISVPRGQGISGWVLEHGSPLLIKDAYADPRFYPDVDRKTGFTTRSILCTPLVHEGKEIGVLQVLNPLDRECFEEVDLEAFSAYGSLAATAIDKLRAIQSQIAQERLDQELTSAREIQASFLPQTLPQLENLEFCAKYRPALHVGGDFYDVIELGPDEVYFVIGDVSGKGMPAALLMAQALSMLRMVLKPGMHPQAVLARWNSLLSGHTIRGMFITALLGRLIPSGRQIELCSAGHCHPFLVDSLGRAKELRLQGCPPLGLLPNLNCPCERFTMEPHQWLLCFTDGLPESFNPEGLSLGRDGMIGLLDRPLPGPDQVIETLEVGEREHRQAAPPHDDLTLLVFGFQMCRPIPARRELEFASHPGNLSLARDFVRQFLATCHIAEADTELMILGLDEACTNIIRYAYAHEPDQLICLACESSETRVTFRIRDFGDQCDPTQLQPRSLDLIQPGGLGLHLIRKAFDTVDFNLKQQGTELVLSRDFTHPLGRSQPA